jgi:hypothetical protein
MTQSSESRDLPGFRLRGAEVTRLESFSDAVLICAHVACGLARRAEIVQ